MITKTQEAKIAEAYTEGLAYFRAILHVGGSIKFVGQSWADGGFICDDDRLPVRDYRGNTVASSTVEQIEATNSDHVAQVEEWWG